MKLHARSGPTPTRRPALVSLALVLLVASTGSRASADNKTVATQLFDDAKQLMDAGKAAEACPKLEQSMKLDPADGTELRLAYCYELVGRDAQAWSLFKAGLEKAKKANNAKRVEFASEHLATLEARLLRVTLVLEGAAQLQGVEVKWDGEDIGAASLGTAFPVDKGAHKLVVRATGKAPYETTVTIGGSKLETVKIPPLRDAAASTATSTAMTGGTPTVAYVAVGAGVVFTVGAIFAHTSSVSAHDDRRADCLMQVTPSCDDTGKGKVRTWEALSFVSGGLALASFGTALYLFVASPSSAKGEGAPRPASAFVRVVPSMGGFHLEGAF